MLIWGRQMAFRGAPRYAKSTLQTVLYENPTIKNYSNASVSTS
jgi:hypothetical protein